MKEAPYDYYQQKLNHFDSSDSTRFSQKYYYNFEFVSNTSDPSLIIFIGGSEELYGGMLSRNSIANVGNKTNSRLFALEHRFYGDSYPENFTKDHYKYLTVEQSIDDLAEFVTFIKKKYCGNSTCSVLLVGGDYGGTLATWFRVKYPHYANFSWISSAPLYVKQLFPEYDLFVAQTLQKKSNSCYRLSKNMLNYFETLIENTTSEKYEEFRGNLSLTKSSDPISALLIASEFFGLITEYDSQINSLDMYCDGERGYFQNMTHYYQTYSMVRKVLGIKSDDLDPLLVGFQDRDQMSWLYQRCTQLGWFQTASGMLKSSLINQTYFDRVCRSVFNTSSKVDSFLNVRYGASNPSTPMSVFSYGSKDPWSQVGAKRSDLSAEKVVHELEGEARCADLNAPRETDGVQLKMTRALIETRLSSWIENDCEKECTHGSCVLGACVCDGSFYGRDCAEAAIPANVFKAFCGQLVALPTFITAAAGIAAWVLFRKNKEENNLGSLVF